MRDTEARELLARIVGAVDKREAAQRGIDHLSGINARRAMGSDELQAHLARLRTSTAARDAARVQLAEALDEARKAVGS